jgi:predicted ATP-dependent serine protease
MNNAAARWRCSVCGFTAERSFDACSRCGTWNAAIPAIGAELEGSSRGRSRRVLLGDAKAKPVARIRVAEPWHTALGGGLAAKSTALVWGSPKVGKTTEALRLATSVPGAFYVPCEPGQDVEFLANVAARCGLDASGLYVARDECRTLSDVIEAIAEPPAPPLVIVDSLSHLGGVDTWQALRGAFPDNALVCIMQVTKDNRMAGANQLRHIVDTIVRVTRKHLVVSENRYAAGPGVVRAKR